MTFLLPNFLIVLYVQTMRINTFIKNRDFLIPALLVLIFIVINLFTLQFEPLKYYNLSRNLSQWDGQHYSSIASEGYQIEDCHPAYPKDYICGNVGWFPIYPMMGKLFSWLPFSAAWILIILSWLSLLIASVLLYNLVKKKFSEKSAVVSLVLMFLFPTSFYFLTAFPYSLFLLVTSIIFWQIEKSDFKLLFITSGLLAVTYPSGIVITLPILYLLIRNYKSYSNKDKLSLSMAVISPGIALLLYAFYYYLKFDNFFLYTDFQGQNYFDHHLSFPLYLFFKDIFVNMNLLWSDYQSLSKFNIGRYIIELRYVPVWISLVLMLIFTTVLYSKKLDISWQIFMFGILLFTPTFGTTDCYYRHIIVAFPFFVMGGVIFESRRKYLLIPYLLITIYLAYFFYQPLYRVSQLM